MTYEGYPLDIEGTDVYDLAISVEREILRKKVNTLARDYNGWAAFHQAQYVDPANGSDSNNGEHPGEAKATIEAAVGDIPTGGGYVHLAPHQDHDVGDGLSLDRRNPIAFQGPGPRPAFGRGSAAQPSPAPRIISSTGAATLFDSRTPVAVTNAIGFAFVGIDFVVSTTTTKVFDFPAVNHCRIVGCGAYHAYDDVVESTFQFIDVPKDAALGTDNSWWRVLDNYVRGGTLLRAGAAAQNTNRWVVAENVNFPGNATDPCIEFSEAHGCTIRDNNLEGANTETAIKLTDICISNLISGNAGEAVDPYIIIDNSYGNVIIPLGISFADTATLVQFLNGASDNQVLVGPASASASLYDSASMIDDQTTNKNNWVTAAGTSGTAQTAKQRTLGLVDDAFPPGTQIGTAFLYVDSADGDLKVKFGDGTVKTVAVD